MLLDQLYIRKIYNDLLEINLFPSPVEGAPSVKKISIVGGKHEEGFLCCYDEEHLYSALSSLITNRIPIDRNFYTEVINIDPSIDGRDFLDPENIFETDLLVIGCVPHADDFGTEALTMKTLIPFSPQLLISPFDTQENPFAWQKAAMRCRAKVITAFDGGIEGSVQNRHFKSFEFAELQNSSILLNHAYAKQLGMSHMLHFDDNIPISQQTL